MNLDDRPDADRVGRQNPPLVGISSARQHAQTTRASRDWRALNARDASLRAARVMMCVTHPIDNRTSFARHGARVTNWVTT
jgi:hypothetical protein